MSVLLAVLRTKYPCCGGRCRLVAIVSVPRELYFRRCPRCLVKWEIDRRTVREYEVGRVDVVDWVRREITNVLVHGRIASVLTPAVTP